MWRPASETSESEASSPLSDPSNARDRTAAGQRPRHLYVASALLIAVAIVLVLHRRHVPTPPVSTAAVHAQALAQGINPNTATAAELTALPGIGRVKAERIAAYRLSHRDADDPEAPVFRRPEDLQGVHGIGPKTVERLRPLLRFEE